MPEALAQAAPLYEDAKVNVNHPKGNPGGPRDYQDRIGTIRDVARAAGEGLFADFHFNPKHALAEQLMWDAEHAPENVGFSHNVEARTARRGERVVVEAITRVQSVDLVADPATTRGLFESAAVAAAAAALPSRRRAGEPPTARNPTLGRHRGWSTATTEPSIPSVASVRREQTAEIDRLRQEVDRLTAAGSDAAEAQPGAAAAARVRPARRGRGRSLGEGRRQRAVPRVAPGGGRRAGDAGPGGGAGAAGADAGRRRRRAAHGEPAAAVARSASGVSRAADRRQEFCGSDYVMRRR